MKHSSIYGIALIVGSVGPIVTMIFHPTGHDLLAASDEMARRSEMVTIATHSLALISIPLALFGFLGVTRRIGGWESPMAQAAFIAYAIGVVAAMCAAVINGLVAPGITRQTLTVDESRRQLLHVVLMSNGLLNQAFARVFVVTSSVAVIFWSACFLKSGKFAQTIGFIGCIIGLVSLAAFFTGHLRLNVHGFGLFIFGQSVWSILVGVLMCRWAFNQHSKNDVGQTLAAN